MTWPTSSVAMTATPADPLVWNQDTASRPAELNLHYGAHVTAHGENFRRRATTPTVVFTFEGTTGRPVAVRMALGVLREMVAAASPYLGPAPGACARTNGQRQAGGDGDG